MLFLIPDQNVQKTILPDLSADDNEARFARADTFSSTVSNVSFVDSSDDALDARERRNALHSDSGVLEEDFPLPANEHLVELRTPGGRTRRLSPAALAQLPAATPSVGGPRSRRRSFVHSPVFTISTISTADSGMGSPSPFSVGLQLPDCDEGDGGPDGPAAPVFQSNDFVLDENHRSVRLKSVIRGNPLFQEDDGDDTALLVDRSAATAAAAAAAADAATAKAKLIAAYRQRVNSVSRRWKISLADASDLCDMVDDTDGSGLSTDTTALRARSRSAPPPLRAAWAASPLAREVAKPRPSQVAVRLLAVPLVDKTDSCEAHRRYELDICDPLTGESYQTVSVRYSTLREAMLGRDKLWAVAGQFPKRGVFKDYTFNKFNACTRGESIREFLETVLNADDNGAIVGAKQLHTALGMDRYGQRALLEVAVARSGAAVFCPGGSGGDIILSPGCGQHGREPVVDGVASLDVPVGRQPQDHVRAGYAGGADAPVPRRKHDGQAPPDRPRRRRATISLHNPRPQSMLLG